MGADDAGASRRGFESGCTPRRTGDLCVRDDHGRGRPAQSGEPADMAEAGRGDSQQVQLRLPWRYELAELVLQPGGAGPSVDEDGALRAPEEQRLTVADREHVHL